MKKKKRLLFLLFSVVIVFAVIMNLLIQGEFQVYDVYYGVDDTIYSDKEAFVNDLTERYNVTREKAESFYDTGDYMKITIGYKITNNSLFPMYVSETIFCNDSRVFVCTEKSESQSKRFVSSGESTFLGTSIILKKSDFTPELIEEIKVYVLTISASPLVKLEFDSDSKVLLRF